MDKLPRYRTGDPELDDDGRRARRGGRGRPERRPGLRAGRLGAAARPRRRRPRRPQGGKRRAQGVAVRLLGVRARIATGARSRSSGRPAPSPTTRSTTRPAGWRRPWPNRTGWSSPAPGPGSWKPAWKAPGRSARSASASASRSRRRPASSSPAIPKLINFRYFFTRKVAFLKESHGFVLLPGRLRDARRGVRAADAGADGQDAAGPDRAARRARRHLLGVVARRSPRPS